MLFLSTYRNRIDKKGRVSVPAPYRAVLAAQEYHGIVAYASFVNPCIEACGMDRIGKLSERIATLDPYSEEHDAFATAILGGSVQLPFDGEGRVMLPEHLISMAQITGEAVFIGKGETFEIWEPAAFEQYAKRARETARDRRSQLRAAPDANAKKV
jgi:MraZ protein